MKTIWGLDLGSASIGWAIVKEDNNITKIVALGSRVIPYDGTEGQDFVKGTGVIWPLSKSGILKHQ